MKRIYALIAAITLCAPAIASADALSFCIVGCDLPPPKPMKFKATTLTEPGVVQPVGTKLWLSPSIGIDVFTRYNKNNEWRAGIIPGVGYGMKYKPANWTLTSNLVSLDVFVQANMVDGSTQHFDLDVLPVITLIDWVSVGFGYRREFSTTKGVPDSGGSLISFGIRKSIASF